MKILHIIFSFNIGGSETMLVDIINKQVQKHEVTLCVINNLYDEKLLNTIDKRVKIILLNRTPSSHNLFDVLRLNYWVHHKTFQVIHCHDCNILKYVWGLFRFTTVLTVHDTHLPLEGIEYYKIVVSISYSVEKDLKQRGLKYSPIIYNGICPELILQTKHCFLEKASEVKILQIGRLEHLKKGQHLALEALAILAKNNPQHYFNLTFIGEGSSYVFLQDMSKKMGINSQVCFLGKRSRKYIISHLKDYDILIQPSLYEGFGLTVVEAMTAGIPVLVSNIEGPMEIINNGEYGFYFNNNDSTDMANCLAYMISHQEIVNTVVRKGKIRALDFTLSKMVDKYERIYSREQ